MIDDGNPISVLLIQKEKPSPDGSVWGGGGSEHCHLVTRTKNCAEEAHTNTSHSLEAFLTHLVTISLLLDTVVCIHGPTSTGGRLQSPDGQRDFSANV